MTRAILDPSQFRAIGDVGRVTRIERGVLLAVGTGRDDGHDVGHEQLRVEVIRPDIVRLKLSTGGVFDEKPTFATSFAMPAAPAFELVDAADRITLTTAKLRVVVKKRGCAIDAYRTDGSVVFESLCGDDGASCGLMVAPSVADHQAGGFFVGRRAAALDQVFGLGQKTGRFDRRGRSFVLWNLDVLAPNALEKNRLLETDFTEPPESTTFDPYYTTIPFFYHARTTGGRSNVRADGTENPDLGGHEVGDGAPDTRCDMAGFFIDNGYKGNVELERDDAILVAFSGGQYTEYVFAGPDMRSILEGYTFVTGRMERPPLWSLGHHQCRWYDYTADQLAGIGREYRARNIPCDVLWLDIGYMDGYRVFTWDGARFPDVPRFFDGLRDDGFRAITIVDPGVKHEPGYTVFDDGQRRDLFCKTSEGSIYEGQVWPGRTAFPDFVKPEARVWWGDLNGKLAASGIAGIWNDMNEPATGQIEPFAMRFDRDGENAPHERYHNQYGLLMAMATRDGLLAALPSLRPFILSRAGFAGIQRVAAQWLGDNSSQWDHLGMGIAMALGMGVSGQPFIGGDMPGFAGEANAALAARWFQYGALTPFCRCHNQQGCGDKYPWSFGPEVEAIARAAIALRYRLLPYLYTAFVRASETGEPVQRPLVFDFQHDAEAHKVDDQYLLGDALLVAPIVQPGQTARDVYLPRIGDGQGKPSDGGQGKSRGDGQGPPSNGKRGTQGGGGEGTWIDWHTGKRYSGGRSVRVDAPLDTIPMFVRGGAVIPMLEAAPATTMGFQPEVLDLRLFVPDEDGEWTSMVIEDDGLTFAYREGAELRTEITLGRQGSQVHLRGRASGRGFPGPRRRRLRITIVGDGAGGPTPIELDVDDAMSPFEITLRH